MKKTRKASTVYWDTCVLLAWIRDEKRKNKQMHGVLSVIRAIEEQGLLMVTSRMTREVEIKPHLHVDGSLARLESLMRRTNVEEIDVTPWIEDRAKELQEYYHDLNDRDGKGILTPRDAIHLATAIEVCVDELHTFDEGKSRPKIGGKRVRTRGLLSLDGDVAGHCLRICAPPVYQLDLLEGDSDD